MRFDKLDLNLLVALDALMEERSVSLSARRLNLSQSAMSGSLGRLREFFGDELLVSTGRSMVPTQLGTELSGQVRQILSLIRSTITTPNTFNHTTAERCFTIIASDYLYDVLLCEVIKQVLSEAPNISFRISMPEFPIQDRFARGELDLFMSLEEFLLDDHPSRNLFDDELAVVGWNENPAFDTTISLEAFQELPHVDVTFGENLARSFSERKLVELNVTRRVELQVQTFSAIPAAVVRSNKIATMNWRHATYFAQFFPLAVSKLPIETPRLREAMQWHWMRKTDPGLLWLRDRIVAGAKAMPAIDDSHR